MAKTAITIYLDKKIKDKLEKRAKKELLDLDELIMDILRRSILSYKGGSSLTDKIDDKFIGYFSRKSKKKK